MDVSEWNEGNIKQNFKVSLAIIIMYFKVLNKMQCYGIMQNLTKLNEV
jgi:hypothetical protein